MRTADQGAIARRVAAPDQTLTSDNYVAYTYSAITIDRILFIKKWT